MNIRLYVAYWMGFWGVVAGALLANNQVLLALVLTALAMLTIITFALARRAGR